MGSCRSQSADHKVVVEERLAGVGVKELWLFLTDVVECLLAVTLVLAPLAWCRLGVGNVDESHHKSVLSRRNWGLPSQVWNDPTAPRQPCWLKKSFVVV